MDKSPRTAAAPKLDTLATELRVTLGSLTRRMREQGRAGDFTPSQTSVLLRLERDGASTISALARAEGVRPQSMRVTVAALMGADAVRGTPDPADGRQTLIALTPSLWRNVTKARAVKEDWLLQALQGALSVEEQRELAAAVVLLRRLAEFN